MPSAEKDPLATESEKQQTLAKRSEAISNLLITNTQVDGVPGLPMTVICTRGIIDVPGGRLLCIMAGK